MSEFDSPWKEALEVYLEQFLAFFFRQIHADIDWTRGHEFLDKELQQIAPESATGRRVVDKLVRVWRKNGKEEWVLIHIEVQSQAEADFELRLFQYYYRIFDRYNQKVVSLAILGDDRANWRPNSFGYTLWGFSINVLFPVVKLLDYADSWHQLEKYENIFAVIVLAHLKSLETRQHPAERHAWKFRLVRSLYERGMRAEDVRQLFRLIDWMMDLPGGLDKLFWQEIQELQEKEHMPFITTPERYGRMEGLRKGIEKCLKIKFGEAGLQLMPQILELNDHEKLEAILEAIESADTPETLRQLWLGDFGNEK